MKWEEAAVQMVGRQIQQVSDTEGRPDLLTLHLSGGFRVEISAYAFQSSFHRNDYVGALNVAVDRR